MSILVPQARVRLAIALLVVCLLSTNTAAAAGLPLAAGGTPVFVTGDERCPATGPVTVTPNGTPTDGQFHQVKITGLGDDCTDVEVAVVLTTTPHTVVLSAEATASGGSATATVAPYSPPPSAAGHALVTSNGWLTPAVWSYDLPAAPAASCRIPATPTVPCTAIISGTTEWGWPTTTHWQRYVTVSTTSVAPVVWEATINLSSDTYPVFANRLHDLQGGLILVSAAGCGESPRTVTVRGTTAWGNYHQIYSGKTSQFQVEGSTTGSGNLLTCPP